MLLPLLADQRGLEAQVHIVLGQLGVHLSLALWGWLRRVHRTVLSWDGDQWLATHPVKRYQQRWVNLALLSCLQQLLLDELEVSFGVIWEGSDVLKQLRELRRKHSRWEKLLGRYVILVIHHLLQALLVGFVSPWELANAKVANEEEKRLDVVFLQVLLVREMGCESGVHGGSDDAEVVLFFDHVLLKRLRRRLLLASLRVNYVHMLVLTRASSATLEALSHIRRRDWIRAALLLSQPKVNQVDEVCLGIIITNNNVGRLQISVDVPL